MLAVDLEALGEVSEEHPPMMIGTPTACLVSSRMRTFQPTANRWLQCTIATPRGFTGVSPLSSGADVRRRHRAEGRAATAAAGEPRLQPRARCGRALLHSHRTVRSLTRSTSPVGAGDGAQYVRTGFPTNNNEQMLCLPRGSYCRDHRRGDTVPPDRSGIPLVRRAWL